MVQKWKLKLTVCLSGFSLFKAGGRLNLNWFSCDKFPHKLDKKWSYFCNVLQKFPSAPKSWNFRWIEKWVEFIERIASEILLSPGFCAIHYQTKSYKNAGKNMPLVQFLRAMLTNWNFPCVYMQNFRNLNLTRFFRYESSKTRVK